jgi:hypothetical protein
VAGVRRAVRLSAPRSAVVALVALAFTAQCGSGEVRFTPDTDARFVAAVVGTYAAAGGLSLVVCEDTSRGACDVPSAGECARECHSIRGSGVGASESLDPDRSGGCGCTTPSAELPVRAELALADGTRVAMRGAITTVPTEADPYGGPIALRLATADENLAPALSGEVRAGRLLLRLSSPSRLDAGPSPWPASPDSAVPFGRASGPESCPPAP